MNIVDAVKTCFKKYATFTGRATRSEFWFFVLFMIIVGIITSIIDYSLFVTIDPSTGMPSGRPPLTTVLQLATMLPYIAVAVRRLHDTDRSGWWVLLIVLPMLGQFVISALPALAMVIGLLSLVAFIIFIVFAVTKGTNGPNRFGG